MPSPPPDRHVRRSGDDYAVSFLSLLPQGQAWPRSPGSTLERACNGLAQYWGYVDGRAGDLLERESDPRKTIELLPDWERAWGLPDPCLEGGMSIGERQRFLVFWMTLIGGQSEAWFQQVASWLGVTIHVSEHSPFMVGISRCGNTPDENGKPRWEIGPPEMRFYWEVSVANARLTWFRCAEAECGVDPHLRIGIAEDLECLLDRWKPAHTDIVYDYSGLSGDDPMAGTP
jgi:uncharacterized protein YmfQ (DUF2313 family)